MTPLIVLHFAVTWALVGLIWTIQVLHYPLFKDVGPDRFVAYHERHMSLITLIVGPLMLAEIGSAAWILYLGERSLLFVFSLGALAAIWGSTVLCQIPLHQKLVRGYDTETLRKLVRSNIWRTIGWTVRGICLAALLFSRTH